MRNDIIPIVSPPAIVRADAEGLAVLATRVREREARNRTDQLEHVKKQAADVWAARPQAERGEWGAWCEKAGISLWAAGCYQRFAKLLVNQQFLSLTPDQQWAEWQRICGNARAENKDDQDTDLDDLEDEEEAREEPGNNRKAFLVRADTAIKCAQHSGWVTRACARHARRVAAVWSELADQVESQL